jgi:hypothetical protein
MLIQALQTLSPALDIPMNIFTFLGKIEFYMLFITFLYWIIDAQLGFRVFMILLSTDVLGTAFKHLFHQPRPYWIGDVKGMGVEESFGIPSTHASDSLSVWSYLAYQVRKRWLWITAIALILLISLSRLYLGVHFPHDVLFGWVIGLTVLYLFIKNEQKAADWISARAINSQIVISFVISLLFIVIGLLVRALIAGSSDAEAWSHFATEARSLSPYFTLAGAFFGAASGYILMKQRACFKTTGEGLQKAGRYLVGMLGVFVILYGLDPLFGLLAADETALGYLLRYIRYGTTTFWAMFGAPWVFLKWNLATSKPKTRRRH